MTYKPFAVTASTFSLVTGQHDGGVILANRAAGITFTLPDATGSGARFEIVVQTTITSNNLIVQAPDASNIMTGNCIMATDNAADVVIAFETAADTDTVTMNGSTKGGIKGDRLVFIDVAADLWSVSIVCSGTGTEVTPFSAAVS